MRIYERVIAKTTKYCPHYKCLFLFITITKLRYAALSLTLVNTEKDFQSLKRESVKELSPEPISMQFCCSATELSHHICKLYKNTFINNYHMWIRNEKNAPVVWTIFRCFSLFQMTTSLPSAKYTCQESLS